jgi:hypothetical protein
MASPGSAQATSTRSAKAASNGEAPRTRVAQVGTFDVENFGDLLFPLLARRALEDRIPNLEVVPYSYRAKPPNEWPFEVHPLGDLIDEVEGFDLVLVGGGDLVRFDKEVAQDYRPSDSVFHHPTALWMAPTLLAAAHQVPVAWNAVGVPGDCPEWAKPAARSVISAVNYLAVRDQRSADRLREVASDTEINVVADTAFAVRELLPKTPSKRFRAELEQLGIDGPYLVLQPSPRLQPFAARLREGLQGLRAQGWSVLELPLGPIHGDSPGTLDLGIETVSPWDWPDPELLIELIGRAGGAIGVSMHLAIVASALGVPVARPSDLTAAESKQAAIDLLPGVSRWPSAAGSPISLPFGERPGPNGDGAESRAASLSRHWDEVAAATQQEGKRDQVVGFMLSVPGQLEDVVGESAAGLDVYRELFDRQTSMLETLNRSFAAEREDRERLRAQLADREQERHGLLAERTTRQLEATHLHEALTSLEQHYAEKTREIEALVDEQQRLVEERHRLTELLEGRRADNQRLKERFEASQAAAAELAEAKALLGRLQTENGRERELLQGARMDRARLSVRVRELEQAHAELVRSAAETEQWLVRLEGSRSWRLTSPLRAVAGKLRRIFRRERLDEGQPDGGG